MTSQDSGAVSPEFTALVFSILQQRANTDRELKLHLDYAVQAAAAVVKDAEIQRLKAELEAQAEPEEEPDDEDPRSATISAVE